MDKLTVRQQLFVTSYINTRNATQSAISAGYAPETAGSQAYQNMRKPAIKNAIDYQMRVAMVSVDVSVEKIADELAVLGFSNIADCYDMNGQLIPIHLLPREVSAAITEVTESYDKDGNRSVKYKMDGKTKNLELLGRYHQMFVDKVEVTTRDQLYTDIVNSATSHPKNAIKQRILEHEGS